MTFEQDDLMITQLRNNGVSKETLKIIEMRLIQKYCFKVCLTQRGVERLEKILGKFWDGIRLPDDEVRLLPLVTMYYIDNHEKFGSHLMSEVIQEITERFGHADGIRWKDWYLKCGFVKNNPDHRQDVEDMFDEDVRMIK